MTAFDINDYQQKANNGDAEAQYQLGLCYAKGLGVEKNGLIDKIHAKKQIPLPNRHFSCYFDRRVICFNFT